ncbi:lytic transglycosylase domain-containing protein (plasmid) [Mesorhizobium mediterraneum]|nr:lytic transglycosylase domain-containing protein [Mesorhizobium mediterraneum]WIW57095.1 lytic transglycosylase domain-containing protein [Mesorhizobium mediterraneum]
MCSSPSRGLSSNKLLAKVAVAISTLAIVSIGQGDAAANAGMFEQSDHGALIEVRRGATSRATPHEKLHLAQFYFDAEAEAVPAERGQAPVSCASLNGLSLATGTAIASETNSVLEFTGASTDEAAFRHPSSSARATKRARDLLSRRLSLPSLPTARSMAKDLTYDQRNMYWLAADFGRRFASRPGVRKSSLDQSMFVDLFTAMIQRESNFNPRAVSSAGAVGLGQLMPRTALDLDVKNPFSAQQNLEGAATYLTEMLDEFGSFELALAAYYAGPAAVRKHGGIPPYRETRQYVSDILHAVSVEPNNIAVQIARAGRMRRPICFR